MSKLSESKIQQLKGNYTKRQHIYGALAESIQSIVERLLKAHNIRFQLVSNRIKDPDSFAEKLRTGSHRITSFEQMADIAGCRVIFYLEGDAKKFAEILEEEFEIVKRDDKVPEDDYNGYHRVVKLKSPRADLPEYKEFQGMQCEIQLTTVPFHAWSEMNHDLIYKDRDQLEDFDPEGYGAIKQILRETMRDYIKPAVQKFEIAEALAVRIREGQQVLGPDFLSTIPSSSSNNEMYEKLKQLEKYVGQLGVTKLAKETDIVGLLDASFEQSKKNKTENIKSAYYGDIPGKTAGDILSVIIDTFDKPGLKYYHYEQTLDWLVRHYSIADTDDAKKKITTAISQLARYDYYVLKQTGYQFQVKLVELLEAKSINEIVDNNAPYFVALESLLATEISGESFDPKTQALTIMQGGLVHNEELAAIRQAALNMLFKAYKEANSMPVKKEVLRILSRAALLPQSGDYSDEIRDMVLGNAKSIMSFYASVAKDTPNPLLMNIEEDCGRLHKRYGDESLQPMLSQIINEAKKRPEYQVYRIICGYTDEIAYTRHWPGNTKELEEVIDRYITTMTAEKYPYWTKIILAMTKSYRPGTRSLTHLSTFLHQVGKKAPEFALVLIDKHVDELGFGMQSLLAGLLISDMRETAITKIDEFIESGKYLEPIALAFSQDRYDTERLVKILDKSVEQGDASSLIATLQSLVSAYDTTQDKKDVRSAVLKAIKELNKLDVTNWAGAVWYIPWLKDLIEDLSGSERQALLDGLLNEDHLDYDSLALLASVAKNEPAGIIKFFEKRVKNQIGKDSFSFDAIPYSLDELSETLAPNAPVVLKEIMSWYKKDEALFHWEASRFIADLFPSFSEPLPTELKKIVESGQEDEVKNIVLRILREYNGQPFVHEILKEVIAKYGNKFDSEINMGFLSTGVVTGEYGIVNAFSAKLEEIKSWEEDENKNVREFYKRFKKYMEKNIEREKKHSDDQKGFLEAGL